VGCKSFPCTDVKHDCYAIPNVVVNASNISIVMISETAPADPNDYYYGSGDPLFQKTTLQAFRDAGVNASSIMDLVEKGVYFTTAVKCGKTGYDVELSTIKECSTILERELALFPDAKAFMLMGDVAIRAVNYIAKTAGEERVIPAGSTYKIRKQEHHFRGKRVFPSYLQAGPSYFVEKSKRRMIAEDIIAATSLVKWETQHHKRNLQIFK
jgi:uracil-DNA glycosylase